MKRIDFVEAQFGEVRPETPAGTNIVVLSGVLPDGRAAAGAGTMPQAAKQELFKREDLRMHWQSTHKTVRMHPARLAVLPPQQSYVCIVGPGGGLAEQLQALLAAAASAACCCGMARVLALPCSVPQDCCLFTLAQHQRQLLHIRCLLCMWEGGIDLLTAEGHMHILLQSSLHVARMLVMPLLPLPCALAASCCPPHEEFA